MVDRPPLTWFYVARRLDRTTRPITPQPRATRPGLLSLGGGPDAPLVLRPHHPTSRCCCRVHAAPRRPPRMAPLNPRAGRPRSRLTAIVHARESHCHLCGLPVDASRKGSNHPLAPTVDELQPIAHGGDPLDPDNCRLAHRICNTTRGVSPITPELRAMCRSIVTTNATSRTVTVHEW